MPYFVIAYCGNLDYTNGLLDQEHLIKENTIDHELYDNDLETRIKIPSGGRDLGKVTFKEPMKISHLYFNRSDTGSGIGYRFTFNNGETFNLRELDHIGSNIYVVDLDNVISVSFRATSSQRYFSVRELDLFGRLSNLEKPEDVKNINVEEKHDRVNLSWELPKIGTYDH